MTEKVLLLEFLSRLHSALTLLNKDKITTY